MRSEIYNCTFKNTNEVSIIIITIYFLIYFFVMEGKRTPD